MLLALFLAPGCERLEVTILRVDRGTVESTVTSVEAGVVEPLHKASLASAVSGRIVRVNVKEGDRVGAGTVLVELENDIEKLRVEEAAKDLERLKSMTDVAVPEQVEHAEFAHRRAKVDYERTFIRATFPGIVAEVNARVGEVTYGSFAIALGALSKGTQERLIYMVDDSVLYVEAQIDESDVFKVKPGQSAKVTLGGIERRTLKSRVTSISPVVSTKEGESRTAKVKVELDPADGTLAPVAYGGGGRTETETIPQGAPCPAPEDGGARTVDNDPPSLLVGMSADLEILVDRVEDVVRVPTSVVIERGEEKGVVVIRDGKLARQKIVTGLGNWEMTEARSGVSPGDVVVVPVDVKLLQEGRAVKVVGEEAPGARR